MSMRTAEYSFVSLIFHDSDCWWNVYFTWLNQWYPIYFLDFRLEMVTSCYMMLHLKKHFCFRIYFNHIKPPFSKNMDPFQRKNHYTLAFGLEDVLFFHILGIVTPIDLTHIFQRGSNHQPVVIWQCFTILDHIKP